MTYCFSCSPSLSTHLLSSHSLSFSLHIWTDSLSIVLLQSPFCLFSSHMSWNGKQTKLTVWYTHEHFRFSVEGEVRPLPQGCSPGPMACQSNNQQQWWPGDLLTPWLSSRASDCRCHRRGAAAETPSGRASRMRACTWPYNGEESVLVKTQLGYIAVTLRSFFFFFISSQHESEKSFVFSNVSKIISQYLFVSMCSMRAHTKLRSQNSISWSDIQPKDICHYWTLKL